MIAQATDGAYERYEEVEGDLPELHRVVVHVDTVPEFKRRPTVVTSILPNSRNTTLSSRKPLLKTPRGPTPGLAPEKFATLGRIAENISILREY